VTQQKSPLWYRCANRAWKLCHAGVVALIAHTKEVERTRYCACCGGLAIYFANTAFCDMTPEEMTFPSEKQETPDQERVESLLTCGTPQFFFCTDHHPLIGPKRKESRALLVPFHKKLRFHLITPNPYK
jgi:hypothetical protein